MNKPGQGRKPKPIELRILQGNPGRRPIPEGVPQPAKLYDPPPPPKHLNKIAKETWEYLVPRLVKCGILTEIDIDTLEQCCTSLAIAKMAVGKIKEDALVMVIKNDNGTIKYAQKTPYLTVYTEALMIFDKFGSKLGLSPSDRVRLQGFSKKEEDEFDEFLKTGKSGNA